MRADGIVRRFDELGRINIPKEIRTKLFGTKYTDGEPMEIFMDKDDIIIRKFEENKDDVCDRKCEKCDLVQDSGKLIDMYEQLAEWLEDYKRIKMLIPIEQSLKNEYNKTIDDFVNACEKQFTTMYGQRYVDMRDIKNIAEQLKAGGKNEQSI